MIKMRQKFIITFSILVEILVIAAEIGLVFAAPCRCDITPKYNSSNYTG